MHSRPQHLNMRGQLHASAVLISREVARVLVLVIMCIVGIVTTEFSETPSRTYVSIPAERL